MHYIIILIIVAGIVAWQITCFYNNLHKLYSFRNTFPENNTELELSKFDGGEPCIIAKHKNSVFEVIINSINDYLQNNKGAVSDFHLIKDIVMRNCDAKEEEIDTQIPVPLYLGLVGTMAGILVGVGFLVFSGELSNLLGTEPKGLIKVIVDLFEIKTNGDGVETLLGGVAIAMFSSIIGIGLTTRGASIFRKCKVEVEKNKNTFLSWIQANLLPKLSDGAAATLEKVTLNLNQFNNTFSQNTHEMREAFTSVKDIYKDLSSVLNAINHLNIREIAKSNILVYEKMKNSTHEIGLLGEQLKGVNQYLQATNNVVQKLDVVFENETTQFKERSEIIKNEVLIIDNEIKQLLSKLSKHTTIHIDEFAKSSVNQNLKFNLVAEEQHHVFQKAIAQQMQLFQDGLIKQESNVTNALNSQNKVLEVKMSITNNLIEQSNSLFEEEINQFEERIGEIKKAVGKIDDGINQSLTALNDNTSIHLEGFMKSSVNQKDKFDKIIEEQQNNYQGVVDQQTQIFQVLLAKQETSITEIIDRQNIALKSKSKEIETIVTELQNMAAIKVSIGNWEQATKEQNGKLDRLIESIEKLAQIESKEGGVINPTIVIPKWVKIASIAIGGSIAFAGMFFVVMLVLALTGVIR